MSAYVSKLTYVVAVSGGVDSMALLHILATSYTPIADSKNSSSHQPPANSYRLIVAHFDHGIREDSAEDRRFVGETARRYGLPFVYDQGHLGAGASEAAAREARYQFLRKIKASVSAQAIVTAHHEDDVLETAIVNLLRGTGRKGLSSLASTSEIHRPLLATPKHNLRRYAEANGLKWREDSTNASANYLRNYIRQNILPRFDASARQQLKELIEKARDANVQIDALLAEQLHLQPAANTLDREWFTMLPHTIAREIMAAWLRSHHIRDFDTKLLERLTIAAKTYAAGKQIDINASFYVLVRRETLVLARRESS
jgi:tRNA(Ile)-lysidine synthase